MLLLKVEFYTFIKQIKTPKTEGLQALPILKR
jgi:hypothetical protein